MYRRIYLCASMFVFLATVFCADTKAGAAQREDSKYSSLSRKIEPWIERVELTEIGKNPGVHPFQLLKRLEKASRKIDSYLKSHPNDTRGLLLAARLGRSLEMVRPTMFEIHSIGQQEDDRYKRIEQLQELCDRAIDLDPANAEAYYWKSRLYGIRHFAFLDEQLAWTYVDLDQAVANARLAVELAPSEISYRETLATYMVLNGQRSEAMEVMGETGGGKHLIYSLLADLEAIPLPANATLWSEETEKRVQKSIEIGWGLDYQYPHLRVQIYVMPMTAAEVEEFFRQTWPRLKFLKIEDGDAAESFATYTQWLHRQEGAMQPVEEEVDIPGRPQEGISLTLTEAKRIDSHAILPIPVGDVFCILAIRNWRLSTE